MVVRSRALALIRADAARQSVIHYFRFYLVLHILTGFTCVLHSNLLVLRFSITLSPFFFLGHAISRSSLQLSVFKLSHWKIDPPNNSRLTVINQRLMNIVMQTSVSPDKCFCSRAKFIDWSAPLNSSSIGFQDCANFAKLRWIFQRGQIYFQPASLLFVQVWVVISKAWLHTRFFYSFCFLAVERASILIASNCNSMSVAFHCSVVDQFFTFIIILYCIFVIYRIKKMDINWCPSLAVRTRKVIQ